MLINQALQAHNSINPNNGDDNQIIRSIKDLLPSWDKFAKSSAVSRKKIHIYVKSTESVPIRRRKHLLNEDQHEAKFKQHRLAQQYDFLRKIMQDYPLRLRQTQEILATLSDNAPLGVAVFMAVKNLSKTLGKDVQFELAMRDESYRNERLTIFVRQHNYNENIMDILADAQSLMDPISEMFGQRLFLTTDLGDPRD